MTLSDFDTPEYRDLRQRVIAGESKLIRERTPDGDFVLREILSPGKRYEDREISLEALFYHCEYMFDKALSETIISDSLIDERDSSVWNYYYLTAMMAGSVVLNIFFIINLYGA